MTTVAQYLSEHGPSRSSRIVEALVASGIAAEAARQRVSRAKPPIRSFPVPLLPKREAFLYLEKDRNGERFWHNFLRDLRETNSITAAAIDGIIARGGIIPAEQFAVVSGATVRPMTGQVPADTVASRLIKSDFLKESHDPEYGRCFHTAPNLAMGTLAAMRTRDITERVLLDGLREWCRKVGLASYNAIRIRGDEDLKPIGPFAFDLAGPTRAAQVPDAAVAQIGGGQRAVDRSRHGEEAPRRFRRSGGDGCANRCRGLAELGLRQAQKAPRLIGDIAGIDEPAALADDVEEIAIFG